jgi:tyrosine-protein phosphatase SIW14
MTTTHRHRSVARIVIAALLIGATAVAVSAVRSRLPKRFEVVESGVLYRSAQPSADHIDRLAEAFGLKTILIVRADESRRVSDEKGRARQRGVNVLHVPIASRKPIPDDQVQQFFDCVDNPASRPVLIHCSAGRHRTGYLCALYRIERQGWSVERALEEMLSFGFDRKSQSAVETQLRAYMALRDRAAGEHAKTSAAMKEIPTP